HRRGVTSRLLFRLHDDEDDDEQDRDAEQAPLPDFELHGSITPDSRPQGKVRGAEPLRACTICAARRLRVSSARMLEHGALGQSRFMTPGVAPDPRGILLGRYGLMVFPTLEGVVS